MKNAMIEKRITLRELCQKTRIDAVRLSDLKMGRAEPTGEEVDKIAMILGNKIKFVDSKTARKAKAELDSFMDSLKKVYKEVKARGFCKGNGGRGNMPCPKCGKDLYFTVASLNGHVWGKCSSKGCLAWMQ